MNECLNRIHGKDRKNQDDLQKGKEREQQKQREKKIGKVKFVSGGVRPPNFENIPIVPLTEERLERDTVGTWIGHVRGVLGTYQMTEAEACHVMVKFIHVPKLKNQLARMLATASLERCAHEALRLGRLWRPSQNIFFPKPEGQSYVTYLQEIWQRAQASGTQLGDRMLVNQILSQVKDEVLRQRLLGNENDLDSMVKEADNTVYHMAQLAKFCKDTAPAETRVEAVKTQASQPTPDAEEQETSTAAAMRFRDQGSVAANPWLSSNGE